MALPSFSGSMPFRAPQRRNSERHDAQSCNRTTSEAGERRGTARGDRGLTLWLSRASLHWVCNDHTGWRVKIGTSRGCPQALDDARSAVHQLVDNWGAASVGWGEPARVIHTHWLYRARRKCAGPRCPVADRRWIVLYCVIGFVAALLALQSRSLSLPGWLGRTMPLITIAAFVIAAICGRQAATAEIDAEVRRRHHHRI